MVDDDVTDRNLQLPNGRTIAWTEVGPADGTAVLRFPGTPGSRWALRGDRTPWHDRRLHVITGERPGFGGSTRLPGRGFGEPADDQASVLDHLGIDRAHVYGGSGAAPHILAFAARHPHRVRAVTIVAGAAPITEDEVEQMIPINQEGHHLAVARDSTGLQQLLTPVAEALLADPLAGFRNLMSTAPADDQAVMRDPHWQWAFTKGLRHAISPGIGGWVDETMAIAGEWADVPYDDVAASVTWYHTEADRNAPLSAARRVVGALPNARLVIWPDGGHFASYHREGEVLDELLAR